MLSWVYIVLLLSKFYQEYINENINEQYYEIDTIIYH